MKNKKFLILFGCSFVIIVCCGFYGIRYAKKRNNSCVNNYIPEEEISEDQERETIVNLYFADKEIGELKPEARLVNVKNLIDSPYKVLIELLINGPKNDKLQKTVPDNTQLLDFSLENDCLTLNFSAEFLNYDKNNIVQKSNLIYSVVNTVTELNEVNVVKFLIDGKPCEEFEEHYVRK